MAIETSPVRKIFIVCLTSVITVSAILAQPGKIDANGIVIAFETFGNKNNEPVILIQGTGATLLHYPVHPCEQLARIIAPAMVIHGDAGKEVASSIPDAELYIIKGMGHDISLKFVNEITDCIENITLKD